MTNWLKSPKEEVFCSQVELMNCRESLLYEIYKGELRTCTIKKLKHTKRWREWCYEPSCTHYLDHTTFKILPLCVD